MDGGEAGMEDAEEKEEGGAKEEEGAAQNCNVFLMKKCGIKPLVLRASRAEGLSC